jgi:hypothetical protein
MKLDIGGDDITKYLQKSLPNLNLSLYEVEMVCLLFSKQMTDYFNLR